MAYHGYLPLLKARLHETQHPPAVLEIGVDRGVMFFSLLAFLARAKKEFFMLGVDVLVQEQVKIVCQNLDLTPTQQSFLIEGNSLDVLPKMVNEGMKFDVVLLDGDHNYHTVSRELQFLDQISYPHTIVVIDDYSGRWATQDLFYSERAGYEEVKNTTQRIDTEQHGVKPAVDEFLASNKNWTYSVPVHGEPIMLQRVVQEQSNG